MGFQIGLSEEPLLGKENLKERCLWEAYRPEKAREQEEIERFYELARRFSFYHVINR